MRATRVLLASLALLLICLVLSGEARRYPDNDELAERPPHHKHRHRHELQPRWPSAGGGKKRASAGNDAEDDYYDDSSDYDDYLDEEDSEEEEYKDRRAGRSHSPKRIGSNHRRYPPPRYHHRGSHHVGSARGHEARAHDRLGANHHRAGSRGTGYPRKRYEDEDSEEKADYDRHRRRYDDSDEEDDYDNEPTGYYHGKHKSPRRGDTKGRRSRYEPPRRDWRYKVDDEEDDYVYDADDEAEESEELENERANRSRKHSARKSFRPAYHEDDEAKSPHRRTAYSKLDEWMKRVRNSSRSHDRRKPNLEPEGAGDEDDELELWKDEEPDDKELDNDFYKNDESTSLKSYDDIIRRLTEERTTTTTTTAAPVKRDYRNTFYDPRRRHANLVDNTGRKKSLQDEEEEDDDDEEAQADANMDYSEDDFLASASSPSTTRAPPPTTSTTTTSTTTTTTTARPWYGTSKNTRNFNSDNSGYQAKNERPMSPISAAKWGDLGTREGVEKTRNSMLSESNKASDFSAAQSHAIRVAREGSCRWPRAKVIPVLDIYYNSTTNYWPHCVILHRCSDDTGCCRHESFTCEAKHIQRVELAFHVVSLHGSQGVAKLTFDNHTECRCSERKNLDNHRNPRHNVQAPANIVKQQRPRKPCRCPSNFLPMITSDDSCECTCPDTDREETCQKLLKGRGYLSNVDRQCIKEEKCMAPKCYYGAYLVETGGCPLKKRFIDSNVWSRRPSNNYQYPRGRSWKSP